MTLVASNVMTDSASRGNLVLHTRVVSGAGGGPDKTILNSPRFLAHQGYPMLCAYLRHPDDGHFKQLEARAKRWDAPLVTVDDFGPLDWRVTRRISALCADQKPAIWHGHDYKTNLLGLVARRHHPMALVTTVHGWVKRTWKTPLYYAIDRKCLSHYDQVICVSEDLYQSCRAAGVPDHKCWHVPNAIDIEEFSRHMSVRDAKRQLGLDETRLVVGAVGRLSPEKGFDQLIRAVATLVLDGFDLELLLAGEGDAEKELQDLAVELQIDDRVHFLGFRTDTIELYQAMDVFALSSLREGLPNVVLEAMAMEVPVLATRVAGVPNLITDGENGLIVPPNSTRRFIEGLRSLASSPEQRRRLANQGRKTIEENYSFARRMSTIKDIYDLTLETRNTLYSV